VPVLYPRDLLKEIQAYDCILSLVTIGEPEYCMQQFTLPAAKVCVRHGTKYLVCYACVSVLNLRRCHAYRAYILCFYSLEIERDRSILYYVHSIQGMLGEVFGSFTIQEIAQFQYRLSGGMKFMISLPPEVMPQFVWRHILFLCIATYAGWKDVGAL